MRKSVILPVVVFLVGLALTVPTLALWGRFPNDKPLTVEGWPKEIVGALNAHKRVYGAGAYDQGWSFYLLGTTEDLNRFLKQVAAERATPVTVVLTSDRGSAKVMAAPLAEDIEIDFSWSLHLYSKHMGFILPLPDETQEAYDVRAKKEMDALPEYSATIVIHCNGPIDVARLEIPLSFETKVGGRLARLSQLHNERRADKKSGDLKSDEPTNERTTRRGGGLFGSSTQPAKKEEKED